MKRAIDVAHWFLSKDSMTHKKVQKLCYYAQAWHSALLGKPLFSDEIQAWVHGPVAPSVFGVYRGYKWLDIPKYSGELPEFEEKTLDVLETVYNTYADFTGDELERITHAEEPWLKARGDLQPWETCTNPIPWEDMKDFYSRLYEQAQND